MTEYAKGRIFKLSIGSDLKNYFCLHHFNKDIEATIVNIIEDTDYHLEHGISKYLIVVQDKNKIDWLWTQVIGLPSMIQYEKPINGQQENLI